MTDPNRISIFAPNGDGPFEMSRANARDLTTHAGWSYGEPATPAPAPVVEETPAVVETPVAEEIVDVENITTDEGSVEDDAEAEVVEDETIEEEDFVTEAEEVLNETSDEDSDDTITPPAPDAVIPSTRTTVEDFADLESRKEVFEYIEVAFPGNKIDGRLNRDKLIALAIELANAQ